MANRAFGEDEPGNPREVFELDKDERWQARLEEARARREIALRDKAAGKAAPRPKPWEEEGATPVPEPIIQERGDDKFDFADRLDQLKGDEAAAKATERRPPPESVTEAAPPAARREETMAARAPRKATDRSVGDTDAPAKPPTHRPPAGEAIEQLRVPEPKTSKPEPGPAAQPPRRARPVPSLVVPGAPDVAAIAQRYAETLRPDVEEPPEPTPPVPPAETPPARAKRSASRTGLRFPALSSRPGVRPLGMALGLLALSALPLTTVAPPLEKGPPMPVIGPFPIQPALGVTWSLYARPYETQSGEWRARGIPSPLSVPSIGPTVSFQGDVALPDAPATGSGGPVVRTGMDASPAGRTGADLGRPGVVQDRPAAMAPPPPPPRDGLLLPDRRPAPSRPATLKEALDEIARREAATTEDAETATDAENDLFQDRPATPPASPLRVTILTPPRADRSIAEAFAADVPRKGHELVRVLEVDQPISTRNVRYFHEQDRAEAARLAREYDAELRDFTWFRPSPVEGTTELWLSGRAGERPSRNAPARSEVPDDFVFEPIVLPPPRQVPERGGIFLDRVMEGVSDALGAGLGLPRRGN